MNTNFMHIANNVNVLLMIRLSLCPGNHQLDRNDQKMQDLLVLSNQFTAIYTFTSTTPLFKNNYNNSLIEERFHNVYLFLYNEYQQ